MFLVEGIVRVNVLRWELVSYIEGILKWNGWMGRWVDEGTVERGSEEGRNKGEVGRGWILESVVGYGEDILF